MAPQIKLVIVKEVLTRSSTDIFLGDLENVYTHTYTQKCLHNTYIHIYMHKGMSLKTLAIALN
jgi:hypothetical protein